MRVYNYVCVCVKGGGVCMGVSVYECMCVWRGCVGEAEGGMYVCVCVGGWGVGVCASNTNNTRRSKLLELFIAYCID